MNTQIAFPQPSRHSDPQTLQRRSGSRHRHPTFAIASMLLLVFAFAASRAAAQSANTATGVGALDEVTTGDNNTADGYHALGSNDIGSSNTAVGRTALFRNTKGGYNTATGHDAMRNNVSGGWNVANGYLALGQNTTGQTNTASGAFALADNTTGSSNTAYGYFALQFNSGGNNTAVGAGALRHNSGHGNIALGISAGRSLTTGNSNIAIGASGVAEESGTIRIGEPANQNRTFIAGIFGSTVPNGVRVVVNPNGRLGTVVSSGRFKEAVKPMDDASEALLALRPVTFRYKHDLDPDGIPQFGLIAEEVEKVNPDLVARDAEGKVNTVRYEAINAMLLNEFLKEHEKVEQLEAALAQQQKQIDRLAAGLQKVSQQELTKAKSRLARRKR